MPSSLRKILCPFFASLAIFAFSFSLAYGATGTIDNTATNQAEVCHDTTCTTPTPGIINFELVDETAIVIDDVTGITGMVWGDQLGWINMNPTGEGVTFADPATGLLTGKAWSQVSGWINFGVTGQSLVIDPTTGEFDGWAWSGGPYGGWIKFDCTDPDTCVRTTWAAASGGGSAGATGITSSGSIARSNIDVCPNIAGNQNTLPYGHTVAQDGSCVIIVDKCPNLNGEQSTVPVGYTTDSLGACVPTSLDFCPNIAGNQPSVPSNYIVDVSGNCVLAPEDFCPDVPGIQDAFSQCYTEETDLCTNLPGLQKITPAGYVLDNSYFFGGVCYPEDFDSCPNIAGRQTSVPIDLVVADNGDCVKEGEDACANLDGIQPKAPKGFYEDNGMCFFEESGAGEEGVKAGINMVFGKISETTAKIYNGIGSGIGNFFKGMGDIITTAAKAVASFVSNVLTQIGNGIKSLFGNITSLFKNIFGSSVSSLGNSFLYVADASNKIGSGIGNLIKSGYNGVVSSLGDSFSYLASVGVGVYDSIR